MLEYVKAGKISIEKVVEKMSHTPAICFQIKDRGYIREGYAADLVLVDMNGGTKVSKENILYRCGWSPFEGHTFPARITHTLVNGSVVYENGQVFESVKGQRLRFDR
jgi:dihydroorotase